MLNIKQIMEFCNCEQIVAKKVFLEMMSEGFDFSECTNAEFKAAALECFAQIS